MADKPKTVRGTIGEASVETSAENAERLGALFVPAAPEKKAPAKKSASSTKKS